MAQKKSQSTKTNTNNGKWYSRREEEFNNHVMLYGKVKNIFVDTDKVQKFSLEVPKTTKNNKTQLCWVSIVNFDIDNPVRDGDILSIEGHLVSNNYDNKWTLEVIADKIETK